MTEKPGTATAPLAPTHSEDKVILSPQKVISPPQKIVVPIALPDLQNSVDHRGIALNRVGVDEVYFPIWIKRKDGGAEKVRAKWAMFGSLLHNYKGTNMSRFVEVLNRWSDKSVTGDSFKGVLGMLKQTLVAGDVYVCAEFPLEVKVLTPVTKLPCIKYHTCKFVGQLNKRDYKFLTEVTVEISTVCPCSKTMSLSDKDCTVGKGAHNQRGVVNLQVLTDPPQPGMWFEDMIDLVEAAGSTKLYPLLKRPDEKYVTEEGYSHPKFVEDVVRDVAVPLRKMPNVKWYRVKCRNAESIHQHFATAYVEQTRTKNGTWTPTHLGFR